MIHISGWFAVCQPIISCISILFLRHCLFSNTVCLCTFHAVCLSCQSVCLCVLGCLRLRCLLSSCLSNTLIEHGILSNVSKCQSKRLGVILKRAQLKWKEGAGHVG